MTIYENETIIELNVNSTKTKVMVKPSDLLLDTLRMKLGLTGAKPGCKNGDCGACTVIMDGYPVKSCLILTVEAVNHEIITIEGLQNTPIQQAFVDCGAFQCGYCTSGFLIVCHSLYMTNPNADENTIEEWLQSNLCRCTSYDEIRSAVEAVFPNAKKVK